MQKADSVEAFNKILNEFKLSGKFSNILEDFLRFSFEVGHNTTGLHRQITFDQVQPEVLDWVSTRSLENSVLQKDYIKDRLSKALTSAVKEGKTLAEFTKDVAGLTKRLGVDKLKSYHVETIFRTEVQNALNYGRFTSQWDAREVAPYWEYVFVDDDNHQEGTMCYKVAQRKTPLILKATDPFWKSWYPPNHYGCRSGVVALTAYQIQNAGITTSSGKPTLGADADESFKGTPWDWN